MSQSCVVTQEGWNTWSWEDPESGITFLSSSKQPPLPRLLRYCLFRCPQKLTDNLYLESGPFLHVAGLGD